MTPKNKYHKGELSYYELSLLSFLREDFPERAKDVEFIRERADHAAETYNQAIKNGHSHIEAEELASDELFKGLAFSPYNTLVIILWNEFSEEIPEDDAKSVALMVLPICSEILAKYSISDDFIDTPEYDLLYTELTGTIQILLEDGKL
ncbi:DUF1896 family protein [Bacteroides sp. 224]|uniref:DUF1896 family protein n=1 Tax=Bacteroides sp. 224 TaxID=2302936 RepID=UPI0013D125E9|nr:DUF1896 family protein [Bacteroides sp. 224]NDV64636.1 DUF1896 domain-containing protein [Bacteroides sp. 224]